jgi:hypothetical protein
MNQDDAWDEEFFPPEPEKGVRIIYRKGDGAELQQDVINSSDPFFLQPSSGLLARVTPIDEKGRPGASWTVVVVELDERTIAFNHLVPLTARNVIVTFEKRGMSTHSVEVELTWCRFDQPHRYTSGGRFILPLGRTA